MSVVKVDEESANKSKTKGSINAGLVIFTRQFSTMINAGLPLVQALDISRSRPRTRSCPRSRAPSCSTWSRGTPSPTLSPSIRTRSATCT
jgi:hypothetical protein